jgi:undecaprenyl-diphosphatase
VPTWKKPWGEAERLRSRLSKIDAELTSKINLLERPGFLRATAVIFAHSGDSWVWFGGIGLLWFFGPTQWRKTELILLLSLLGLAGIVALIKFIVRRKRPPGEWGAIYRRTDPHSFPSGHAARAALIAVLTIGLGPPWLGILMWMWALLVIFARVAMGVHYFSDVVAGAFLGILVAALELFFI